MSDDERSVDQYRINRSAASQPLTDDDKPDRRYSDTYGQTKAQRDKNK